MASLQRQQPELMNYHFNMNTKVKYYTVRINETAKSSKHRLWYMQLAGQEFKTTLAIVENSSGSLVAAFKCITSPFYHIYPLHCTVIKEETLEFKHHNLV